MSPSCLPHSLCAPSQAYMWCEADRGPPPQTLPSRLAIPWASVSKSLEMPPVLVYATYNLLNWRRIDALGPIELGNIVCINVSFAPQNFPRPP